VMPSPFPFAITSAADIADGCSRINSDLLGFVVVLVFCTAMFGREILHGRSATGNFSAGSCERFSAHRRSHILRWIEDAGERKREKRIAKTVEVAVQ
jgi:hypothetical protein